MRIIVETMTRAQAAASRRPELRDMQCVIIEPSHTPRIYWGPSFTGYYEDIKDAGTFTLAGILGRESLQRTRIELAIGFIKETEPEPGPDGKVRKRRADLLLGHSLFAMVQASPNNPQVRAHVMARCRVMPPDELDTFERIKDWIECDLEVAGDAKGASLLKPAATPAPPPTEAFVVMTHNSETERGHCKYSQVNISQSAVPIDRTLIASLVEDNPQDLEEIIDRISEHVDENADQHERESDSTGLEHDDYETDDYDGREVDFSRRELTAQITTYLRTTLTREQLEELGL